MNPLIIHPFDTVNGNQIHILREDLLPVACGGNKVRIGERLVEDARRKGATVLVAYGNSRSNLCRALAMLCAKAGLRCVIVSPGDEDGSRVRTLNSRIIDLYRTRVVPCQKGAAVAETVARTLAEIEAQGEIPYYIFGNRFGTGNEGVLMSAYFDLAGTLSRYEEGSGIRFDRIALALGTGSTYAGLLCGYRALGRDTRVTGFTIARPIERCRAALSLFFENFRERNPDFNGELEPEISDISLAGGYSRTPPELLDFLRDLLREKAVFMDATYAGKAYWGVVRMLEQGNIRNEKILFVHTGSLPLSFDTLLKE